MGIIRSNARGDDVASNSLILLEPGHRPESTSLGMEDVKYICRSLGQNGLCNKVTRICHRIKKKSDVIMLTCRSVSLKIITRKEIYAIDKSKLPERAGRKATGPKGMAGLPK